MRRHHFPSLHFCHSFWFSDVVLLFLESRCSFVENSSGRKWNGSDSRGVGGKRGRHARKFRTIKLKKTISHGFLTYFDKAKRKKALFCRICFIIRFILSKRFRENSPIITDVGLPRVTNSRKIFWAGGVSRVDARAWRTKMSNLCKTFFRAD